jgi:hypothetical protein
LISKVGVTGSAGVLARCTQGGVSKLDHQSSALSATPASPRWIGDLVAVALVGLPSPGRRRPRQWLDSGLKVPAPSLAGTCYRKSYGGSVWTYNA